MRKFVNNFDREELPNNLSLQLFISRYVPILRFIPGFKDHGKAIKELSNEIIAAVEGNFDLKQILKI